MVMYSLPEEINPVDLEPACAGYVTTTATSAEVNNDTKIIDVDEYRVKDDLNKEMGKMEKKKKLQDEEKRIREADKKLRRQERIINSRKILLKFIKMNWLVSLVQSYEELLYVLFVDVTLGMVLFSIMYIGYIIVCSSSFTLQDILVKIGGAIVISIICIIVQLNLTKNTKNEKEG